jgi:hypothetical protein
MKDYFLSFLNLWWVAQVSLLRPGFLLANALAGMNVKSSA